MESSPHRTQSRCPTRTSQYAAQPHEHFESGIAYCAERYSFSVVAEQCSCVTSKEKSTVKEMWRSEDEGHSDAWWTTAPSSGWWTTSGSGTEGCWTKSPGRGQDRKWTDTVKVGERFFMKEAKYLEEQKRRVEQSVRRWPRGKTADVGARKEGTRIQVLSSFAKSTKTNEQKKVRFMVSPEVPHTDVDERDVDEFERDELH